MIDSLTSFVAPITAKPFRSEIYMLCHLISQTKVKHYHSLGFNQKLPPYCPSLLACGVLTKSINSFGISWILCALSFDILFTALLHYPQRCFIIHNAGGLLYTALVYYSQRSFIINNASWFIGSLFVDYSQHWRFKIHSAGDL